VVALLVLVVVGALPPAELPPSPSVEPPPLFVVLELFWAHPAPMANAASAATASPRNRQFIAKLLRASWRGASRRVAARGGQPRRGTPPRQYWLLVPPTQTPMPSG
jgi:hypothetical protein